MVDNLAAARQPLRDFEIQSYLLMGLGCEYDLFVISVTTQVDPRSLHDIYSHLLAHKTRIE